MSMEHDIHISCKRFQYVGFFYWLLNFYIVRLVATDKRRLSQRGWQTSLGSLAKCSRKSCWNLVLTWAIQKCCCLPVLTYVHSDFTSCHLIYKVTAQDSHVSVKQMRDLWPRKPQCLGSQEELPFCKRNSEQCCWFIQKESVKNSSEKELGKSPRGVVIKSWCFLRSLF